MRMRKSAVRKRKAKAFAWALKHPETGLFVGTTASKRAWAWTNITRHAAEYQQEFVEAYRKDGLRCVRVEIREV